MVITDYILQWNSVIGENFCDQEGYKISRYYRDDYPLSLVKPNGLFLKIKKDKQKRGGLKNVSLLQCSRYYSCRY